VKVLVIGGGGFVGSHVAEHYVKKGEEVAVFDNLSRAELLGREIKRPRYNWNYLKNSSNVELIEGDIRNAVKVKSAAKGADVIVHTAAQTAVTTSLKDPRTDFEVNALGTFNVLEAARKEGSTVIFCSTNKVYGNNVNRIPVKEKESRYEFSDPKFKNGVPEDLSIDLCEHTPYGCSKLAADLYVQDYAERGEIDAAVFRMSCIYGTRQFGVEDQGWVSWFTIATILGKPITIYGDGKQVRDVLHVSDLVEAFDSFVRRRDKLHSEVFNIGGGVNNTLSLLELLDLLEKETGKRSELKYSDWRPGDQKVYISDISKAEKKLRWKPKVGPEKGIKNLVNWIKENEDLSS